MSSSDAGMGSREPATATSLCSSKLGNQVTIITNATLEAPVILRLELWKDFNADFVCLSNRLSEKTEGTEDYARKMKERHQSETGEGVSMYLRSANIIERSKYMAPFGLLCDKSDYEHILVTSEQIDEWECKDEEVLKQTAVRKRRERWRLDIQLPCAVSVVMYDIGERKPQLPVLWKVPNSKRGSE
jgi:hypothetical protein